MAYLKRKTLQQRKGGAVLITAAVFAGISLLWMLVYTFPVSERPANTFFQSVVPLVIAHQGGEHLAPSNTLEAYRQAEELGVDVIEFDIHMTKDGHLVAIHDDSVDRTTDREGKVNDLTLEEIQSLDAGHYFKDLEGEYSYRGQGVFIPTVEQIFNDIQDMDWNIEIKATNDPALYEEISSQLWSLIKEYGLEERVLIASFDQQIIDKIIDISEGEALVSGGRQEVTRFVIFHKLFLNSLYVPKVDAIQIPVEENIFNLKDKKLIQGARNRNMAVYYWTINDQEEMEKLFDLGADGIVTDRPDLMIDLIERD
ncbi:glycerophosphodiester phosphodiesterase [Salipaludibacillus aurantiacus]|uniref:Glycerophosphoryl diester phosphodiesterase n=1 Tax=Salipaludibacillus aurantiacus TaxID=1601833 RepID=A0A1H9XA30_9BACI|nr:glycerophosphodiester phosphodiesterase [Salipaludibacillus aurantiacus]SES43068.1 glycerophosphoryl diester phosphodiesterase [Salipaludibacillus aurantiacus]